MIEMFRRSLRPFDQFEFHSRVVGVANGTPRVALFTMQAQVALKLPGDLPVTVETALIHLGCTAAVAFQALQRTLEF